MDREKEIKEMAKYFCQPCEMYCELGRNECNADQYYGNCSICIDAAKELVDAGYRKTEDVKREAIKEFAERLEEKAVESCDMYTCGMAVTIGDIRELVKEYLG